jgi:hypothetical protein
LGAFLSFWLALPVQERDSCDSFLLNSVRHFLEAFTRCVIHVVFIWSEILRGMSESIFRVKEKKKFLLSWTTRYLPKLNFFFAKGQGNLKSENACLPIRFGGHHVLHFSQISP